MDTRETILKAMRMLGEEAPAGSKVILFGSHARGDATAQSDIDLLVVEPNLTDIVSEMARLSKVVKWMRVPLDLIVISRAAYQRWQDTPCTLAYEASKEGKVLHDLL